MWHDLTARVCQLELRGKAVRRESYYVGSRPGCRVEHDQCVAIGFHLFSDRGCRVYYYLPCQLLDAGVVGYGIVLGIPSDRSGQNVVLLVHQKPVPCLANVLSRVHSADEQ